MDAVAAMHASDEPLDEPEAPPRVQLGELLLRDGFIDDGQLEQALHEGSETGERLGEVVVRRGWATDDDVAKLLAEQWQLGYVDRASIWFDADALTRMSRSEARRLEALPTRVEGGRVVVAVAEPTEQRLAALREVIGPDTVVVVVPKPALDAGLSSQLLAGDEEFEGSAEPQPRVEDEPEQEQEQEQEQGQDPEPVAEEPAPPALHAVKPETEQEAAPEPEQLAAHRVPEGEPDLADLLGALGEAARDAVALQQHASNLAVQLEGLAGELAAVSERIVQRTELTDRLKAQLHDLTRTLDTLQ